MESKSDNIVAKRKEGEKCNFFKVAGQGGKGFSNQNINPWFNVTNNSKERSIL
jgi:hypothetical protein